MPTSWTVGGRLADRFAGGPEYARAKARSEQRALRRKALAGKSSRRATILHISSADGKRLQRG